MDVTGNTQLAEVFDTDRFAELYSQSRRTEEDHLSMATKFLMGLFEQYQVPYGILGGWALRLRGSQRVTLDIDVAVNTTMEIIKDMLNLEERVCVPRTHGTVCLQIFVHTGGRWEGHYCPVPEKPVSVDIAFDGNLGGPLDMSYGTLQILPVPRTLMGDTPVNVIDIFHQFQSKLQAHANRRETQPGIDYADLRFLATTYPDAIHVRRHDFGLEHRLVFLNDCDPGHTEWCKWLLGLE